MHVIDSLAPGGSERMAVEIANASDKKKYRVSVCVTRSDITLSTQLNPDVGFLALERKRKFDPNKQKHFHSFLDQQRVNLLHIHGWSSLLFIAFLHLAYRDLWELGLVFQDPRSLWGC